MPPGPSGARPECVVIKIGTSSLISAQRPDSAKLDALADAVVRLRADGLRPVLVASGAIALGSARLGLTGPQPDSTRQLAAAVGQGLLFDAFRRAFEERGLLAAQILLTPPDLIGPEHQGGTRAVLEGALDADLVPVVNENDAVMVRNNDVLAALVAALLGAGRLVLLTDVPGLYESDPRQDATARRIPEVRAMTPAVERLAGVTAHGLGTGGMAAKLCAVWIATTAGVAAVIAGADTEDGAVRAVRGDDIGTLVHPRRPAKQPDVGLLWRALSAPPSGRLVCRPEALAVIEDGGPLLGRHFHSRTGSFASGAVVDLVAPGPRPDGAEVVARGRVSVGSAALATAGEELTVLHHTAYISFLEV
ncbi:glutamate 5-kinase [Streptomyces clavifer]|uniref:glutamate 5-kinase n=1 Tax=Streptomyces clavifer TaxID=68188 RepID=UPI0033C14EB9